ncbi:MAG TPA: DUF2961 domain-containing protein [Ktedonobacteraceae bacterium]
MKALKNVYGQIAWLLLLSLLLTGDIPAPASGAVLAALPCPLSLTDGNQPVQAAPPLYLGLDAYRHWDRLAYLELGDRVEGAATADPAGSNQDSVHIVRTLSDGRHVLFDQAGPGMVTFLRMQEHLGAPWQLLLDGQRPLAVQATDLGQMQPGSMPAQAFPFPLSLNPQESQGSSLLMTAIPFQHNLTWIAQAGSGNFYALYRKLPYGTPLQTWTARAAPVAVLALLRCTNGAPVPATLAARQGTLDLVGGLPTELAALTGPSQIRSLDFRVPFAEMAAFGNARLQIFWDQDTTPAVDTPVRFLAGDGAGVYQPANRPLVASWLTHIGGDGRSFMDFTISWPMPFAHSAHLVLLSPQSLSHIAWSVRYEPFLAPENWWGTFHANDVSIAHPVAGQDMTFLDVQGSGKLVGTVINFTRPGPTLEGDPHIYLDDSQTPQIAGTGTEEWGLGGDYWQGGHQVSLPQGGLPSSSNNPPGTDHDGAALYRYLVADSIPFNRHLLVRWEHGGEDQATLPYRASVFWYGTPAQTAQLSDEIWPARAASRTAHAYTWPGAQEFSLTAGYEDTVTSPLSSAMVVETRGRTSFRMLLNPRNLGTFLRRTFDSCVANQRADVYVDDQFAGTWYDAGASARAESAGHPRCWRDEDFPLPASLTAGKRAVTISLRFVATNHPRDTVWTATDYQMYCFVLP